MHFSGTILVSWNKQNITKWPKVKDKHINPRNCVHRILYLYNYESSILMLFGLSILNFLNTQ